MAVSDTLDRDMDLTNNPDIDAVADTPVEAGRDVSAVVCVPTFRRPEHLRLTLESLAGQRVDRPFAVVVVDNDAAGRKGMPVADAFFEAGLLSGISLIEPRQGNCHAINTAFATARTAYPRADKFLMIDDDEIAAPDWLQRMLQAAAVSGADVIGGPVAPTFEDATKAALAAHPVFCPAYAASGPVPMIYGSGNCLITRRAFDRLADPDFDLRFNFLGGGDTDFFMRCKRSGATFHWAADAMITETVPSSRTEMAWIVRRGLRIGAINYHVARRTAGTPAGHARVAVKMLAKMPLALIRGARLAVGAPAPVYALHPLTVAAGALLAMVGIEPQQYKG